MLQLRPGTAKWKLKKKKKSLNSLLDTDKTVKKKNKTECLPIYGWANYHHFTVNLQGGNIWFDCRPDCNTPAEGQASRESKQQL